MQSPEPSALSGQTMKPCEWCGVMTRGEILIELVRSTISTNIVGNLKRNIKAPRTATCCDKCKARIQAKDESTVDVVQGKQLDVYEVLEMIEKEGS